MEDNTNQTAGEPQATPVAAPVAQEHNTLMGVLAYIGPLVIVSYLAAKDDAFVKFHIKQGLILFIATVALQIVRSYLWILYDIISIAYLAVGVLSIIGIINVIQKKEKELPLVGHLSKHFTF